MTRPPRAVAVLLAVLAGCGVDAHPAGEPSDAAAPLISSESDFVAASGHRVRLVGIVHLDKEGLVLDTDFAVVSIPQAPRSLEQMVGRKVMLVGECDTFVPVIEYTPEGQREQVQQRQNSDGTPARVFVMTSVTVRKP